MPESSKLKLSITKAKKTKAKKGFKNDIFHDVHYSKLLSIFMKVNTYLDNKD